MNFLIDYHARELLFGPALPLPHSARLISGPDSHFAIIESSIQGKTVRLQVDTGFDGLILYRSETHQANLQSYESHIATGSQTLPSHTVVQSDFRIGDWRLSHAQLTVLEDASPPSGELDGVIGTAFLSQLRVAFDFEKQMIYWE